MADENKIAEEAAKAAELKAVEEAAAKKVIDDKKNADDAAAKVTKVASDERILDSKEDKIDPTKASADAAEAAKKAAMDAEDKKNNGVDEDEEDKKAKDKAKAAEDAAALVAAEAAAKNAKDMKKAVYSKTMCSEDLDLIKDAFSEIELALASKYSFVDLVKLNASLALEVAGARVEREAAEASKKAEARIAELATAGLALSGDKAKAQKEKVTAMTDEAFASYKSDLTEFKEALENGEGFDKEAIEKARASADNSSVTNNITSVSLLNKMSQI